MADRIKFSENWMQKCAAELQGVADVINDAISKMSALHLEKENGAECKVGMKMLKLSDMTANTGSDIAKEWLMAINSAAKHLSGEVTGVRDAVNNAVNILNGAESRILQLIQIKCDNKTPEERLAEALAFARQAKVRLIQHCLDNDPTNFKNAVNTVGLTAAATTGAFYRVAGGDVAALREYLAAEQLLKGLLDTYSGVGAFDAGNGVKDSADIMKQICAMGKTAAAVTAEITIEDADKVLDSVKAFDDLIDNMDAINWASEAGDAAGLIGDGAANMYMAYQLCQMDEATAAELRSKLALIDDPAARQAANLLSMAGDPVACTAYALINSGVDYAEAGLENAVNVITDANPTVKIAKNAISAAQGATNMLMNTENTAKAAGVAKMLCDSRDAAYDAVQQAMDAYNADPTDANFQRLENTYEAYNEIYAETIEAYHTALDTNQESALGKLVYGKNDNSFYTDMANNIRGRNR